jgi:uncharacterized protein
MKKSSRKIINDPVYGFISVDDPLILEIIAHPYYQRLRRISQMAFAHLVYPGAMHSRLHHSIGAYHLMCGALSELRNKGVDISNEEQLSAKAAILLHDIGHGPYSHALENILVPGVHHESLSVMIMRELNSVFNGALDTAISIFTNRHPKKYLQQLISGQLDVDRMDYLTRDSFYTGVSEGVIGYDRIIKMLTVHEGNLVVEEKAIYSIEKFLVSRRLMYWQVYLHKTVLAAEMMLVKIITRVKELLASGVTVVSGSDAFDLFLQGKITAGNIGDHLDAFCSLDDYDVLGATKKWMHHPDKILSRLCSMLVHRRLLKVKLQAEPFDGETLVQHRNRICRSLHITEKESEYFLFTGEAENTTYDPSEERITILFKDGSTKDISGVDNSLIHQTLALPVKKFYICYLSNSENETSHPSFV